MTKTFLIKEWSKCQNENENFDNVLKKWTVDIEEANRNDYEFYEFDKTDEEGKESRHRSLEKSYDLRNKKEIVKMTNFLKFHIGYNQVDYFPQEVNYYLAKPKEKLELYKKEIIEITNQLKNIEKGKKIKLKKNLLDRKFFLINRQSSLEEQLKISPIKRILTEVTNDGRFIATLVFIFLSSYLTQKLFPRNQTIKLDIHCNNSRDLKQGLKLLSDFSPTYSIEYKYNDDKEEEEILVIHCRLTHSDYYLYSSYLKKIGKIYEN